MFEFFKEFTKHETKIPSMCGCGRQTNVFSGGKCFLCNERQEIGSFIRQLIDSQTDEDFEQFERRWAEYKKDALVAQLE